MSSDGADSDAGGRRYGMDRRQTSGPGRRREPLIGIGREEQRVQFATRAFFLVIYLAYFNFGGVLRADLSLALINLVAVVYAVLQVASWLHATRARISPWRWRAAMWVDLVMVGIAVFVDQNPVTPAFLVFLMVIFGNGMRYGVRVFTEAVVGTIAVGLVDVVLRFEAFRAALSPAHGLFLLVFVVVMIYARVLMGRVEASRLRAERAMHRDPLTGLLNRRGFEIEAERILADPTCGARCTLLFADLDGFKAVNDDLGHPAGDQVLRRVAAILSETARADDICGRYGGDEFVLLCPGISRHDGLRIGERLRAAVVQWADAEGCRLSLSIGIGEAPAHGVSIEQLMARVDAAMYAGRREHGRGSIRVIAADGASA